LKTPDLEVIIIDMGISAIGGEILLLIETKLNPEKLAFALLTFLL